MRKLFYMGLESYEARYTLQLTEWNRRVFDRRGLDVVYVPGNSITSIHKARMPRTCGTKTLVALPEDSND